MTVIVAVSDGRRVCMAADSQGSTGGMKDTLATPKIVRIGKRLFAYSTGMEIGQALLYHAPGEFDGDYDMPLDRWCATKLVPWLREWFKSTGLMETRDGAAWMPFTMLVAQGGEFVGVESNASVVRYAGQFATEGSGKALARGALFALLNCYELEKPRGTPEVAARMAVAASCVFDDGCGPPIVVEWTEAASYQGMVYRDKDGNEFSADGSPLDGRPFTTALDAPGDGSLHIRQR